MRVYFDSSVFVSAIVRKDQAMLAAQKLLFEAAEGKLEAVASVLAWDETVWETKRASGNEVSLGVGNRLLSLRGVEFVPVSQDTLYAAQRIREKYGLDPRDAIHAASAIENGCEQIISADKDFDRVKELRRKPFL